MLLLEPYLTTVLSDGVFDLYGPQFADFVQPSDELLGRCIAELGIQLADMQGYFAGSQLPGFAPSPIVSCFSPRALARGEGTAPIRCTRVFLFCPSTVCDQCFKAILMSPL